MNVFYSLIGLFTDKPFYIFTNPESLILEKAMFNIYNAINKKCRMSC